MRMQMDIIYDFLFRQIVKEVEKFKRYVSSIEIPN